MITALILAAGFSRRMGRPKINLPWGNTTVLGQILATLNEAGVKDSVVVYGEYPVRNLPNEFNLNVQFIQNEQADRTGMLTSLQVGLSNMKPECDAALVTLGDQPQIEAEVVGSILHCFLETKNLLVIPSYRMRRGHPWILGRPLWNSVLSMDPANTMRDFLKTHEELIFYVNVNSASILQDLDTPDDYDQYRPQSTKPG